MQKVSVESIEGYNYLPSQAKNWKPKVVEKDEPTDAIPNEWNEALDQAGEKNTLKFVLWIIILNY